MIKGRLTLRPDIIEGESISSYLLRLANINKINIAQLFRLVRNEKKYIKVGSYVEKLDFYPKDIIKIENFVSITNLPINLIDHHSFSSTIIKWFGDKAGKIIFLKETEVKNRKFCLSCLVETGAYKLLWQVKEIRLCNKHLTKLKSKCDKCGHALPYVNENIALFKCCNCSALLLEQEEQIETNSFVIESQLQCYKDWKLIQTLSSSPKFNSINHRKLAAQVLYIADNNRIKLKKHQMRRLRNIVKGKSDDRVTLNLLFSVLRNVGINLEEIIDIEVPISYLRPLFRTNVSKLGRCLSPWCNYRGTKFKMKRIMKSTTQRYVPFRHKFDLVSVCTGCWMRFGVNKETEKWECLFDEANLIYYKVKPLYENGVSKTAIQRELKLPIFKLYSVLGYILQYQLLEVDDNDEEKFQFSNTVLEQFKILSKNSHSFKLMASAAKKSYGWGVLEFSYLYWHPEVQRNIAFKENRGDKKEDGKTKMPNSLLVDEINEEISLVVREIAASLEIVEKNELFAEIRKDETIYTKRDNLLAEKIIIYNKINELVQSKTEKEEQIHVKEIYKYISKTYSYLVRNHIDIKKYISKIANASKVNQTEIKRKKLKEAIKKLYLEKQEITPDKLSEILGVAEISISTGNGIFRRLGDTINKTINEIISE
ncbi:TniQ family protein [Litchfieldia alkalitelluris]|uniref:TniQ family protein n=1 Tax=Litchfieldia alkalitelluris TaxID=304268 RepID=UPI000997B31D|nr:TniQ family protein [Litchfieldia alkalitelluris]